MSRSRFFAEAPVPDAGELALAAPDVHHLRDVLRLGPGDEIEVAFAGDVWIVRLDAVDEGVTGTRIERLPHAAPLPRVTLAQALAKGEKMDIVVRQATELGVLRIVPFAAERSVVRLEPARAAVRTERWRRIAGSAAKQAHRADVPQVDEPVTLPDLPSALAGTTMLVAWEDADGAPGIAAALATANGARGVSVIVGPEGGLTSGEVALLRDAGAACVSLGPTILRTETAGVVATALALHSLGGLGASRG
jgi:16S rRNA (uracil1498-N3)-methyltransferase